MIFCLLFCQSFRTEESLFFKTILFTEIVIIFFSFFPQNTNIYIHQPLTDCLIISGAFTTIVLSTVFFSYMMVNRFYHIQNFSLCKLTWVYNDKNNRGKKETITQHSNIICKIFYSFCSLSLKIVANAKVHDIKIKFV